MEHIPKSLSPTGAIDSAPKDFSLYVSVCVGGGRLLALARLEVYGRGRGGVCV